nr:immunoglobulin heavy chain junction region [Macaca mulatta]
CASPFSYGSSYKDRFDVW